MIRYLTGMEQWVRYAEYIHRLEGSGASVRMGRVYIKDIFGARSLRSVRSFWALGGGWSFLVCFFLGRRTFLPHFDPGGFEHLERLEFFLTLFFVVYLWAFERPSPFS